MKVYIRFRDLGHGMSSVEGVFQTLELAKEGVKLARLGTLEDCWSERSEASWEAPNSKYYIKEFDVLSEPLVI